MAGVEDFRSLERVGEHAGAIHDKADAGLWDLRTKSHIHTYSVAMCWAACDRLANAARTLGLEDRQAFWQDRADTIRATIESRAARDGNSRLSATFGGDDIDASRSEEHTSELQSLMRISYAVFCLKKKK